ncbi:MAG: hypothetical protein SFW09_03980 [Hyphomicrobiaceae bacterium]|nr:hypothetical protein [Hyphomicrobiaceae bacterium]
MTGLPLKDEHVASAPSVVRSGMLDSPERRSFLSDVAIEHGPRDLLGRVFLKADTALREKGIFVSFGDYDELRAINKANLDTWTPLLPIFDPAQSGHPEANGLILIGRNASGKPVFAQSGRMFDLGDRTLKDEIESLRIFYQEPQEKAWPGESMTCTAPIAETIRGRVGYNGGLWLHPECRGLNLVPSTVQISRGTILTRWGPGVIFSLMLSKVIDNGLAKVARLNVDWEVLMTNTPTKRGATLRAALVWITAEQQALHFEDYLGLSSAGGNAQVDGAVVKGAADQKLTA